MTEERIRQLTDAVPIQGSATVLRDLVAAAIRQALAERDREIAAKRALAGEKVPE